MDLYYYDYTTIIFNFFGRCYHITDYDDALHLLTKLLSCGLLFGDSTAGNWMDQYKNRPKKQSQGRSHSVKISKQRGRKALKLLPQYREKTVLQFRRKITEASALTPNRMVVVVLENKMGVPVKLTHKKNPTLWKTNPNKPLPRKQNKN